MSGVVIALTIWCQCQAFTLLKKSTSLLPSFVRSVSCSSSWQIMQKSVTKPQVEGNLNLQTVNRLAPVRNKREGTMMSHVHVDRHGTSTRSSSRIPTTLQNVILSSNRGNEVHVPPPKNVAYKVFFRGWLGRTFSSESKAGGKPSKSGQKKNIQLLVEEASEIKNQESNPTKHANSRPVLARRDSNSTLTPAPDRRSTKVTRKKVSY